MSRDYCLLQSVQNGAGSHPASSSVVSRDLPRSKRPGHEADHSLSYSVEVQIRYRCTSISIPPSPCVFVTSTDETLPHKYQTLLGSCVCGSGSSASRKIVHSAITVRIRYCSGS